MNHPEIILTEEDHARLQQWLTLEASGVLSHPTVLADLSEQLDRARIVEAHQMPATTVSMNTTITLRDVETRRVETYTLVYPDQADIANRKLSVLAPAGANLLGMSVGEICHWQIPSGTRQLRIESVSERPHPSGLFQGSLEN